jgi:diacylglycerol kinase (ATP)
MNKVKEFFASRVRAFGYAFQGWWHVLRTQRNAWIHALATALVVLVAAWLNLPARDWAVLILTIALVWTAEFINTSIEAIVDLASPEQHPLAKAGKDVGAAAVLIAALSSVLVGLLILGPPLWEKIQGWLTH